MTQIKTVGVIGAGQMGAGIAHVCALAGYAVVLADAARERLDEGMAVIDRNLGRQVAKGVVTQADADAALGRIKASDMKAVAGCDLVIEAATEDEDVKKEIFRSLSGSLKPFATQAPPVRVRISSSDCGTGERSLPLGKY